MLQSQLLYKAAAIMRERGMCRFELEDDDFRVCAMGALNLADHGTYRYVHGYYDSDAVLNAASYVAGFCGQVKPPPLRLRPWDIYELLVAVNNDNSATTERMASLLELAADARRVEELAAESERQVTHHQQGASLVAA